MPPPQEEPLDLSTAVGWCHGCGKRRVLCAFGQCVACHVGSERRETPDDQAGYLCCGWWATGRLEEAWLCPTCGREVNAAAGNGRA
jgi:hypothetical protein